ncbi:CoA ester lyase [Sulfitobacter sabulilitoris]|uniref:CoA ester lyase n=1 Tax=Sulfitobacter sabulilitoris TaxID=2562655 RepID=A0A5S3PAY5_9RHOB|nr:CoA ester lyase [Sulfitobacter sabulilitoris]
MERPRRSLLFTPATRAQSFAKSMHSGADIVCVDLEDSVPPDQKEAARTPAVAFLTGPEHATAQRALRINGLGTRAGHVDLLAVLDAAPRHGGLLLPKVGHAEEIRRVDALLSEAGSPVEIYALIETMEGLENAGAIAAASGRLRMLVFGAVDLSAEMGSDLSDAALAYPRGRIVQAGRRHGLDVMDVPSLDFRNTQAVAAAASAARAQGFTGKASIHPVTLEAINAAFTPDATEVARARAVIAAFRAAPNGLAVLDGQLIEAPVIKAMEKLLAVADRAGVECDE